MSTRLDSWCVTVNMGAFDDIRHESDKYQSAQSYVESCQHLYTMPLVIMPWSKVRVLVEHWETVAFCSGADVRHHGKEIARD